MPLRFPRDILVSRYERFQELLRSRGIDAVMLRTLSSFAYFTGVKWLRPALLIPSEGEPTAFVIRGEEELFESYTWIRNIVTYAEGGELMAAVSRAIRERGYRVVGLEFGIEHDAYILFYEMFKRLNPGVRVVDVSEEIYGLRMVKDGYEQEAIRAAGRRAAKAMERALSSVKPGVSESEIAAEAYHELYRMGCEHPLVYVNVGPHPRIHAEPLGDVRAREGVFVTVVIGADYAGYYANMARTVFLGSLSGAAERAVRCMDEVYRVAKELTKPGTRFIDVMQGLDKVYRDYGMLRHRVAGYAHGVGLQVEEPPITTIVPKHRMIRVRPGMALAFVHAPIALPGYGQVKREDTFLVKEDGELENVTELS